jgi:hypothetical protein
MFQSLEVTDQPISNHWNLAKILCEAIPAMSGPLGGFSNDLVRVTKSYDMNHLYGPGRAGALWPSRTEHRNKQGRWLHGDYKDAAYIYVHGLYDKCTDLMKGNAP